MRRQHPPETIEAVARRLCREAGHDPDQLVGRRKEHRRWEHYVAAALAHLKGRAPHVPSRPEEPREP